MKIARLIQCGLLVSLAAATGAASAVRPAQAEELTGTLKKIADSNVIVLGYRESSVPLSYLDDNQNVIGYSHDIALRIVEAIKKQLNRPKLEVKQIPINGQNRIPLMQNGTIDLECGGTTNNRERRQQVDFSDTIEITETLLLTKKTSGIHDLADLAGKSVVVTAGTTSERYLRQYVAEKNLNVNLISARDHSQSFLMVQSDRAGAFFMDSDVLAALLAKARDADQYIVTGQPQTTEPLACMLRRDDPQFKALVDRTVAAIETSGEAERLYNRWFDAPIPPNGVNLHIPLSQKMKELFAHPNDQSAD